MSFVINPAQMLTWWLKTVHHRLWQNSRPYHEHVTSAIPPGSTNQSLPRCTIYQVVPLRHLWTLA